MMNSSFKQIAKIIKKSKSVAIFTHINPDGDALGSSLPLALAIRALGKNVDVFIKNEFTYSQSLIFDKSLVKNGNCNPKDYDLMISTDVPSKERLGDYGGIFLSFENRIVLDHHTNIDTKSKYYYIDTEMSSCAEITFEVIKALKVKITEPMASYLYAGLSSDTNSFINSNVNENSFETALQLLRYGAKINEISEKLNKSKTKKEIELISYLWKNYVIDNDVAYCLVDFNTLTKLNSKKSDCDSFSSDLMCIDSINYSFSLVEFEQGNFSLSLRCKENYNVMKIAEKLGGGGHLCASGAKFKAKDMQEAKNLVLSAFNK